MIKTIEAVILEAGNVRLLEPAHLESTYCAIVLIVDESGASVDETAVLSEASLVPQSFNSPTQPEVI